MTQETKLLGFIDLSGNGPIFRAPTAAEAREHKAREAAMAKARAKARKAKSSK
jgi:hypothetical protein